MPVGGRLSLFQWAWSFLTDSQWVNNIINEGFCIPFTSMPPTGQHQKSDFQHSLSNRLVIEWEVLSMLGKKAIKEASEVGFTSHLFMVPKKTGNV